MGGHLDITVFSLNQSEYERNIICELHDPGDIFQTNENVHDFDAQRGCCQNFEFMTLWSGVLVGFFERRIGYILEVNIHEFLLGLLKGKSALLQCRTCTASAKIQNCEIYDLMVELLLF